MWIGLAVLNCSVPGWSQGQSGIVAAFVFIEACPSFTSGPPAPATTLYINKQGQIQKCVVQDAKVLSVATGQTDAAGMFKMLAAADTAALQTILNRDDSLMVLSQKHPAAYRIACQRHDGLLIHWYGTTNMMNAPLRQIVNAALALGAAANLHAQTNTSVWIRADVLDETSIQELKSDNRFNTLPTGASLNPSLTRTLAAPFQLTPIPAGTNPFAPFYSRFAPDEGYYLLLNAKNQFYQVNSFKTLPLASEAAR